MTAGQGLAYARHNLGLSLESLASRTGFGVEVLRSIEETDLPRLPSGASLEAAIRAFAAAVQLDAEAICRRYLANLPILANTAEALTAFEPEADQESRPSESGLFLYERAYGPAPSRASTPRTTDIAGRALLLRAEPDPASPQLVGADEPSGSRLPPAPGRGSRNPIGVLLLASALAVIGGYLLSARAQWWTADWWPRRSHQLAADDSKRVREPDTNVAQAVASGAAPPSPAAATNSNDAAPTPSPDRPTPSPERSTSRGAPLESKETPGAKAAERASPAANPRPESAGDASAPSAFIVVPGSQPEALSTATTASTARGELSGSWNVIAHDEDTTGASPTNRVAYYVRLQQRGSEVVGNGYRVSESGAEAASSQQAVSVRGTLNGERLNLNFNGREHERFVLYRSDDGVFRGRFRRDGAPASRSSIVTLSPREPGR